MKLRTDSLKIPVSAALAILVVTGILTANAASVQAAAAPSTVSSGGLITSGPSRHECVTPNVSGTGLNALQSAITKFNVLTDTSVSCVSAYLNGAPTWSTWEHPWITEPQYGYTAWVAESPKDRQLVLQVDLIPTDLKNIKNPVKWERSCASGDFNSNATQLGSSLVAAGLQNSVLRLAAEMNGTWEVDYVGKTALERQLWLGCFRNEVRSLRRAAGQHFLIDWNPNPCQYNLSYFPLYPGNSFVNVIGLDLFDASCAAPKTPYSFARLENQPAGLVAIESFAASHHKPLSLPEWGLSKLPSGDDPNFIDGIGSVFDSGDFAFETYFDVPGSAGTALPLGPHTPLSIPAFQRWFASGVRP